MNTHKYDFKNAPYGTTHFNPETDDVAACWVKIEGDDIYFQYAHNLITQEWRYWFSVKSKHCGHKALLDRFIEINPKETSQVSFVVGDIELASEEWIDGVPQVGTVCEYSLDKIRWYTCEVLFVGKSCIVASCHTNMGEIEQYLYFEQAFFRPIKTAEEIKREEAVADMRKDIMDHDYNIESLDEHLINKGWSKK